MGKGYPHTNNIKWSEEEILMMLSLADEKNMSAQRIALRMSTIKGENITRSAVLGIMFRVRKETDLAFPDRSDDGTMSKEWVNIPRNPPAAKSARAR